MIRFTARLAGVPIGIEAQYEATREAYRDFWTEETPAFFLQAPKQREELWLYRQIGEQLPEYGALLVHGSAVALDGKAYLFMAPSGTGKSTHTRLWREHFGHRATMINDDKPLLRFEKNQILVCGSPWQGKHRLGCNCSVPLKGIALLSRDISNAVTPAALPREFPDLLQQCYKPRDPALCARMLELLDRLTQAVPLYRLKCNTRPEAAEIAYQGMKGGTL